MNKKKAAHSRAMAKNIKDLLKKRRGAEKRRAKKRARGMRRAIRPYSVIPYRPGLNPHYYSPSDRKYYVPNPFGDKFIVPACPQYQDWLDSRYYHQIKNSAIKARYAFARKHCLRKGLSMKARYECFKLHWKQYKPGSKNTIHQVRNRVQRDCMKYKYNPKLRRMCFKAHVKHYEGKLLAEQQEEEEANDNNDTENMVEAENESGSDDNNDDESLVLIKVNGDDADSEEESGSDDESD